MLNMTDKEQIAKDVDNLYQAQAERDMHDIEWEEYKGITFESKIVDLIIQREAAAEARGLMGKGTSHGKWFTNDIGLDALIVSLKTAYPNQEIELRVVTAAQQSAEKENV
jgi:hypothetical protein